MWNDSKHVGQWNINEFRVRPAVDSSVPALPAGKVITPLFPEGGVVLFSFLRARFVCLGKGGGESIIHSRGRCFTRFPLNQVTMRANSAPENQHTGACACEKPSTALGMLLFILLDQNPKPIRGRTYSSGKCVGGCSSAALVGFRRDFRFSLLRTLLMVLLNV